MKHKVCETNLQREQQEYFVSQASSLEKQFKQRRINFYSCLTIEDARNQIEALILAFAKSEEDTRIGFSDSVSLHQLGIYELVNGINNVKVTNPFERFDDGKYKIFGKLPPGQLDLPRNEYYELMEKLWDGMRSTLLSDIFIIGANAITLKGQIVSTDGTGNRVGGMIFGPRKVIIIVGRNKICKDVDDAIKRNRNVAAPLNYFRHNNKHHGRFDNPCMKLGYCVDCNSPRRACLKTVIIDGEMEGYKDRTHLILVNEDLGL